MNKKGLKILLVGGTGTIGNGLVNKLLDDENIDTIRVLSRDEFKQFEMERFINHKNKNKLRFLIGDVRDYDRLERAMRGVDKVFNLAAMKHVPSCEYNPDEAIKTNVVGMENIIKAAIKNEVDCVVFTSTDKATNPTNAYGATKLLAEKLVQSANYSKGPIKTRFIAVRFGNVMGSRGSVIPLFRKQILEEGRITITDPKMNRFMMTLSQAVNLILKVSDIAVGGEVFVLKMPVIRLKDLADIVIEETCKKLNIQNDIKVETIGLRPGERLYEELMTEIESTAAFDLGDMYAILPTTFAPEYYKDKYSNHTKAPLETYTSSNQNPIAKETLREFLLAEKLV